jgi:hypothetical protein
MELTGLGPDRKLGHEVEFAQELTYRLAGVVSLAELFELGKDAIKSGFGLAYRHVRVVFALAFEARVVLEKLFPVERRQTLAGRTPKRPGWT